MFRLALAAVTAAFSLTAFAATGDSSLKIKADEVKEESNKPEGQDIDTIITNPKLRAETGSKSRYSLSTSLGYAGGSLHDTLGEKRPNITGATGSTDFPALNGSVSAKYNINTTNSIFGGIGVRWVAPLAGTETPKGYNGNRVDADNPYFIYQYVYNMAGLQSSVQLRQTFITTSDLRNRGFVTSWGLGQNSVYEIGTSGISVGFNTYVGLGYFDKHTEELKGGQSDYSWAFSPAIEYRLSDKLNLRADTNLFVYEHIRSQRNAWTFRRQDVSQNFGIGYAVARDIYVSPGVSFVLGNLRADRTTWSLGATVNMF